MLDLDLRPLFAGSRSPHSPATIEVLFVCTGNICRSPVAEQLLRLRIADLDVEVSSVGTSGQVEKPMTRDAVRLATSLGVPRDEARAHRARWMTQFHLVDTDLVLTMTREQRDEVLTLAPGRSRTTFTVPEFAMLAAGVSDDDLLDAAEAAGADPHARVRAAVRLVSRETWTGEPGDDDVVDPLGQPWPVYKQSAVEMLPGIDQVARLLRIALP